MTRRCSHCSTNGHNSRTCPSRGGGAVAGGIGGVKLFGVRLTDGSIIKKSASMGSLSSAHYHSSSSAAASPNPSSPSSDPLRDAIHEPDGYLSDDPGQATCSSNRRGERKKGNSIKKRKKHTHTHQQIRSLSFLFLFLFLVCILIYLICWKLNKI